MPLSKKEGALTHAPRQALVCPRRNAFGTPSFGRASSSVLLSKLPVLSWTVAEAANLLFWFSGLVFYPSLKIEPPKPGGDKRGFEIAKQELLRDASR